MSDERKKDDEGFIVEQPINVVVNAPAAAPVPSHIGLIELEVQFFEDDEGDPEAWRLFLRARAKELHERLDQEGGPWERHQVAIKLLALTVPTELVREIERGESSPEKPFPIDGKPRIVH